MKTVKNFIDEAIAKGFKIETLEGGIYINDYVLSYQEGNRFQRVYVRDFYDESTKNNLILSIATFATIHRRSILQECCVKPTMVD